MEKRQKIPSATVFRLSVYRRYLMEMRQKGKRTVSSQELARATQVNPAQLRKDLSYFGRFGVRGVGYNVEGLLQELSSILGLNDRWNLCLLGAGRIGQALLLGGQLELRGYNVVAVFDTRESELGKPLVQGLTVMSVDVAGVLIPELDISICMVTEEIPGLKDAIGTLVEKGIKGIFSLVPIAHEVSVDVPVQYLDFTTILDTLTYTLSHSHCSQGIGPGNISKKLGQNLFFQNARAS